MVQNLLPVENPVHHMTTEKPHFNLVPQVGIDLFVFMNRLENVGSGGSVCKFKFIERFFGDFEFVAFLKVLDGNVLKYFADFVVSVFVVKVSFHVFLLKFRNIFLEVTGLDTLIPLVGLDTDFLQTFRELSALQVMEKWIGVKDAGLEEVKFSGQPFSKAQVR